MPYNEHLATRLRKAYAAVPDVVEKKMFGGLAIMVGGHMSCGVAGDDLMARVGPQEYEKCLAEPHAREMDFTGRPLKGFIFVAPAGVKTDAALRKWVKRSLKFVQSLPAK